MNNLPKKNNQPDFELPDFGGFKAKNKTSCDGPPPQ